MTTFTTEDRIDAERKQLTLTDDDIEPLISNMPESPSNDELYEFAYAILRKAQEK